MDGDSDTEFTFRLRFVVPPSRRLPFASERVVVSDEAGRTVALVSAEKGKDLQDAQHVALVGAGYHGEQNALAAGGEWRARLEHAFACMDLGADFGDRGAQGGVFSPAALDLMRDASGVPQMNDAQGLIAYPSALKPVFWRGQATGIARPLPEDVLKAIERARAEVTITQAKRLAFDLFTASRFVEQADGRFMVLMMAFETLVEQGYKSQELLVHIDRLIAATAASDLSPGEKEGLNGGLANLRRESINSAGRRLASTMSGRLYGDATPEELWARCYRARNRLVHGHAGRMSLSEIGLLAGCLEVLVGHLIAGRAFVDDVLA